MHTPVRRRIYWFICLPRGERKMEKDVDDLIYDSAEARPSER